MTHFTDGSWVENDFTPTFCTRWHFQNSFEWNQYFKSKKTVKSIFDQILWNYGKDFLRHSEYFPPVSALYYRGFKSFVNTYCVRFSLSILFCQEITILAKFYEPSPPIFRVELPYSVAALLIPHCKLRCWSSGWAPLHFFDSGNGVQVVWLFTLADASIAPWPSLA